MSAHHTDNDFGADNVASNPVTARTVLPDLVTRSSSGLPSGDPTLWVTALQQRLECLGGHLARQAEQICLASGPASREFAVFAGQIAGVVPGGRRCRRRVQGRHPQHVRSQQFAGTCLFSEVVVVVEMTVVMARGALRGAAR